MGKLQKLALVIFFLLAVFVPLSSVSANSAPPPSEFWFTFDVQNGLLPSVERFTLVFCSDEECSYSVDVTQVPNSVDMPYENELYCYENWCKWRMYTPIESGVRIDLPGFQNYPKKMFFKLKVRFSDGERISNVFDGIPVRIGDEAYFKLSTDKQTLAISADDNFKSPFLSGKFRSFLLTLAVEPLAFAILIWLWKREKFRTVLNYYLLSLLANGISYPMLWGFFPSITLYHYQSAEALGLIFLFGGLTFSTFLIFSVYFKGNISEGSRGFAILLLPFLCFLIFVTSFRYGVYEEPISSTGISASSAIMLIEVLAVVFESVFIYFMSRRKISLLQSFVACLFANAASFGLGQIVFK